MEPKVFITGPGRSGTTFLVQLLTRLGFDTGFEPYNEVYVDAWRAGCEIGPDTYTMEQGHYVMRQAFNNSPRIIKGPVWAYLLKYLHKNGIVEIERVVMPLRDLTDSTLSRLSVGLDFMLDKDFIGVDHNRDNREEHQENVLAMLTGKVLEVCFLFNIPLTLMKFPQLVVDEEYCYQKVCEIDGRIGTEDFKRVWRQLANPEQIQSYTTAIKV